MIQVALGEEAKGGLRAARSTLGLGGMSQYLLGPDCPQPGSRIPSC